MRHKGGGQQAATKARGPGTLLHKRAPCGGPLRTAVCRYQREGRAVAGLLTLRYCRGLPARGLAIASAPAGTSVTPAVQVPRAQR